MAVKKFDPNFTMHLIRRRATQTLTQLLTSMWHGLYDLVDLCKRNAVPFLQNCVLEHVLVPNDAPIFDPLFDASPHMLYRV